MAQATKEPQNSAKIFTLIRQDIDMFVTQSNKSLFDSFESRL